MLAGFAPPVEKALPAPPSLAQAARDYLAANLALNVTGLQDALTSIITDAWLGGSVTAAVAARGAVVPSMLSVGGTWDAWTPGWAGAAAQITDPGLSTALADVGLTVKGLADTTIDQMGTQLAEGVASGASMDSIASEISDFVGGDSDRAHMIADTEAARAAGSASLDTYGANGVSGKEWLLAEDPCPICQDNADAGILAVDDSFPSGDDAPPAHPRCLPGWVRVETASHGITVQAATERDYVGDLVVIKTALGHELAATPNHPIATPRGWVAIDALREGDHIISSTRRQWMASSVDPNVDDVPPTIEQVTKTLPVAFGPMPTASEDFHGDGAGSDVHVVRADRSLLSNREAASAKHSGEAGLDRGDIAQLRLDTQRPSAQEVSRLRDAANGGVGGGAQTATLVRPCALHANEHGLPATAGADAVVKQHSAEGVPADTDGFCQHLLASAAQVAADEVIGVNRLPFTGHVFNLDTSAGWYTSNGIVTHNCRCAVSPADLPDQTAATDEVPTE